MTRREAYEATVVAVRQAYESGLPAWEVQEAIGHGARSAGRLGEADLAARTAEIIQGGVPVADVGVVDWREDLDDDKEDEKEAS